MKYAGIVLVRLYQVLVRPLVPPNTCKYHPSCSEYALQALQTYGFVRGTVLVGWRVLRCNPWSDGGVDRPSWPPWRTPKDTFPVVSRSDSG